MLLSDGASAGAGAGAGAAARRYTFSQRLLLLPPFHLPHLSHSIRQYTSAYVSIRQHTGAYGSIRHFTSSTPTYQSAKLMTPAPAAYTHATRTRTRTRTRTHTHTRTHTYGHSHISLHRLHAPLLQERGRGGGFASVFVLLYQ